MLAPKRGLDEWLIMWGINSTRPLPSGILTSVEKCKVENKIYLPPEKTLYTFVRLTGLLWSNCQHLVA